MKKFAAFCMSFVLMLSLFACSSGGTTEPAADSGADTAATEPSEDTDDAAEAEPVDDTVYEEFRWPTSECGKLLPPTKSNVGDMSWESSEGFQVEVAQTTEDDYLDYIEACKEAGFDVNYISGDDYYYAYNEEGYYLGLKYLGDNVMYLRIDDPMDK